MENPKNAVAGQSDPLLDEIRVVKQAVSARAGHDVARLCRELQLDQRQSMRRVIRRSHRTVRGGK